MNCRKAEEYLSEYMESTLSNGEPLSVEAPLPATEMKQVTIHLAECSKCSALLDAMRTTVSMCRSCPDQEPDNRLVDHILARTSGYTRPMPFLERFRRFVIQPLLMPRFAVGTGSAVLFFALLVNWMLPAVSGDLSVTAQSPIYTFMDRSVQRIYGQGLRVYDKKNEWQAQLTFLADNMVHRLQYMIERLDVPDEGIQTPSERDQQKDNTTQEKNGSPGQVFYSDAQERSRPFFDREYGRSLDSQGSRLAACCTLTSG